MSNTSKQPSILVVDDEWRLARNIARFLERNGWRATAVSSVEAANAAITEQLPDAALVDLKLPDVSGAELCRMLHERYPDLPVMVMSARIAPELEPKLRAFGVRAFLTKPFSLNDMLSQVNGLGIHRQATAPARQLRLVEGSPAPRRGGPRVVLYSHDTMGLGHMRRNILIARSLAESRLKASVLLVSGAREVGRFELPTGIDCLVLPSYRKSAEGAYFARHLDLETRELMRLRSHTIAASVSAFEPDVMIVDNVPRGALDELDPTLTSLNARGHTRCVLGLRDVLDSPETVRKEWEKRRNLSAIDWHYDQVWIYGDPAIYDLCEAYGFGPSFENKARFTGYLDARRRAVPKPDAVTPLASDGPADQPDRPYNLCLVGGGQDGYALARAFAQAPQPQGQLGILISGPFMAHDHLAELQAIAARRDDLRVLGFVEEPTLLLKTARRVVAMGGYNTVNEVLAFARPTLIVPRVRPAGSRSCAPNAWRRWAMWTCCIPMPCTRRPSPTGWHPAPSPAPPNLSNSTVSTASRNWWKT